MFPIFDLFHPLSRTRRRLLRELPDQRAEDFDVSSISAFSSLPGALDPIHVREALNDASGWLALYRSLPSGTGAASCPLPLASSLCAEFARLVTCEAGMRMEGGERAVFLKQQLLPFFDNLRTAVEYACACGGVMFKPCPDENGRLSVSVVLPGDFIPLARQNGQIVSAAFYDHVIENGKPYVREEQHRMEKDGYRILSRVWRGSQPGSDSAALPPDAISAFHGIKQEVVIEGLKTPLFSYFGIPLGNRRDPGSPLGVSVFSRVSPLLIEAEKQLGRLLWEYEGGELAIDASDELFLTGRDGQPILPAGKERLFRPNALDPVSSGGEAIKVFAPALRDESLINGLNRLMILIEDGVGLSRGTISDPSGTVRTATEIRSQKQRTYVTVSDIQRSLSSSLLLLTDACRALCDLYQLAPASPVSASFFFGDSVLTDTESQRDKALEEVRLGLLTKEEYRSRFVIPVSDIGII